MVDLGEFLDTPLKFVQSFDDMKVERLDSLRRSIGYDQLG
jgi:hypothetical protein